MANSLVARWRTLVVRLIAEEHGQDLIEYGLLASIIGLAGVGLFPIIRTKMGNTFGNWGVNINNLWIPGPPAP
jgi:Flp pilus assembly pilin Flp